MVNLKHWTGRKITLETGYDVFDGIVEVEKEGERRYFFRILAPNSADFGGKRLPLSNNGIVSINYGKVRGLIVRSVRDNGFRGRDRKMAEILYGDIN